jgi:hypothetical protein
MPSVVPMDNLLGASLSGVVVSAVWVLQLFVNADKPHFFVQYLWNYLCANLLVLYKIQHKRPIWHEIYGCRALVSFRRLPLKNQHSELWPGYWIAFISLWLPWWSTTILLATGEMLLLWAERPGILREFSNGRHAADQLQDSGGPDCGRSTIAPCR